MDKKSKVITLGYDEDNPGWSIMPGHVSAKEFNAEFRKDWSGDDIQESELKHEYWISNLDGSWWKSEKEVDGSEPVTVLEW